MAEKGLAVLLKNVVRQSPVLVVARLVLSAQRQGNLQGHTPATPEIPSAATAGFKPQQA